MGDPAVVVGDDGRILRAAPWADVRPDVSAAETVIDTGDSLLLPGLVNAHTHLALSDLAGRLPRPRRFSDWLKAIVRHGRTRGPDAPAAAVRQGAALSLAAGVTTVADASFAGAGAEALADSPLRATVFVELFGHDRPKIERSLAMAAARARLLESLGLSVGLSPHAPYTAGPAAYLAAMAEADRSRWPLTTHLHETRDEIDLYRTGRMPLAQWWQLRLMLWRAGFKPPRTSPIFALADAGALARPWVVAHANYLDDAEIDLLRRSGSTVVYCPRSHHYFGHADHPYRRLAAAGVPVALGTDSLASAPSLSILDEMRFLAARDNAPPESLLPMATAAGADALGLGRTVGRLADGELADLVALPLGRHEAADPWQALMTCEAAPAAVWIAGRPVSTNRSGPTPPV
jgi:cytosine/adenosine deaminase-related metal-dependent hydrolase